VRLSASRNTDVNQLFIEMEEILLSLFKDGAQGSYPIIRSAINLIEQDNEIKLSELAKQLSISQKHLHSLFAKYLGITPKRLKDLYKFHKVIEHIGYNKPKSWSEISAAFN